MSSRPWTYEELDVLYKNYCVMDTKELADKLNRTVQSVESKAMKMHLYRTPSYTSNELQYAKTYGKELGKALLFLVPNRSLSDVEVLLSCTK